MPSVNSESSLDRIEFDSEPHVEKQINQDCDSGFIGLAGGAK